MLHKILRRALLLALVSATGIPRLYGQERARVELRAEAYRAGRGASEDSAESYRRTDTLTWAVVGLSVLHHVDHVLRGNHSGWPFTSEITPFTYSLAIYPVVGTAYALDAGPATFVAVDAAGTLGLLLAHSLLEPPRDQYDPWAEGSNRLGLRAPLLGRVAQGVSIALSLALAAHLSSSIADGIEFGFAWRRSSLRAEDRR